MKWSALSLFSFVFLSVLVFACGKDSSDGFGGSSPSPMSGSRNMPGLKPGTLTAGEWNDLDSWAFWTNIIESSEFKNWPLHWQFNNKSRFKVKVIDQDSSPLIDVPVILKFGTQNLFSCRTDNYGVAELWLNLFDLITQQTKELKIDIGNGSKLIDEVIAYDSGVNYAVLQTVPFDNNMDLAFVIDATGSMGDELRYVQQELMDVISKVKSSNSTLSIQTSAVFYRDEGDDYVTKLSGFTNNHDQTIDFIQQQSAGGGGDVPEAVHSALDVAINQLSWSASAKTRILFLLLDAPPHDKQNVKESIKNNINMAASKGIKIIPITASGIGKETEFLMRFMAITTNGTYVFITDDSGVGDKHLKPSVGNYKVELLNELMERLIKKYAE